MARNLLYLEKYTSNYLKKNYKMAFFYMAPARGDMPLYLLEVIIKNRLEYLKCIQRKQPPLYNEHTVEGSVNDNVGHYVLCVLAIIGKKTELPNFVMTSEVALFRNRLGLLPAYDLRSLAKKILRSLKRLNIQHKFVEPLYVLCQRLILRHLSHHVTSECSNNCTLFKLLIKFQHCLKLVSKRKVELRNGFASLSCNQWKEYLVTMFSENLKQRIFNTQVDLIKCDPRIIQLYEAIKINFSKFNDVPCANILKHHEVDIHTEFFPPCMNNLHLHLRKRHRLSHDQRFYYSLFLKDVGMPIEEAVLFWKLEYGLNPNGSHNCCHSWEKDEKKYLYGIRHLYGLEGARKSYYSKNCKFIQNCDNSYSEGGCPFKCFDNNKMQQILKMSDQNEIYKNISKLKEDKEYTEACMFYLKVRSSDQSTECNKFTFSPVKYYLLAKNFSTH